MCGAPCGDARTRPSTRPRGPTVRRSSTARTTFPGPLDMVRSVCTSSKQFDTGLTGLAVGNRGGGVGTSEHIHTPQRTHATSARRLPRGTGDLSLAHLVCDRALNLPFARTVSGFRGPKAAMTTLYGRTVKVLACGNGVIKDRPLALREHKKRRSGPSGRSNWPIGTRRERAEERQRRSPAAAAAQPSRWSSMAAPEVACCR